MSTFFEDTMQGLLEAVEIQTGNFTLRTENSQLFCKASYQYHQCAGV